MLRTCTPPGTGGGNPLIPTMGAPIPERGKAGRRRGGSPGAVPSDREVDQLRGLGVSRRCKPSSGGRR
eukprot:13322110-Alexandrium_andersonii.AAC.1